jgi:hypothetical protein
VTRDAKPVLGGVAVAVIVTVAVGLFLPFMARTAAEWTRAGLQLTMWQRVLVEISRFVARFFVFLLPWLFAFCVLGALALSRRASRNAAV